MAAKKDAPPPPPPPKPLEPVIRHDSRDWVLDRTGNTVRPVTPPPMAPPPAPLQTDKKK